MHQTQRSLLELARTHDLSKLSLKKIAELAGEKYPQSAKHHLLQLDKKGLLRYPLGETAIKAGSFSTISVPIVGSANCGPATLLAEDNIEGYLKVSPNLLTTTKNIFALKAVGHSMNTAQAGKKVKKPIEDGDYVIVEQKSYQPVDGDYIVSIIDGASNIKRYKRVNTEEVALISESTKDYAPIYIHADDVFSICGEVIQVFRSA